MSTHPRSYLVFVQSMLDKEKQANLQLLRNVYESVLRGVLEHVYDASCLHFQHYTTSYTVTDIL